ncbi:ankyrin repeat domain-containing protein [Aspergillus glaucus CBS 516.65]|uniref:Uncharacterized protein n=1 Tax=Aspergillus glaucus CBS 516.65 TaxID=1160497 RepID=A0A1L9VNH1_ASPGL|nr:hypothetical protein ASPGLDRAFT_45397 [Aspergillus glaucus CBS 516.65]OJJ85430.1 hypothetical protein ASPGLDRAFT_45397 [Aspergillus glaucus CBS 516.65]
MSQFSTTVSSPSEPAIQLEAENAASTGNAPQLQHSLNNGARLDTFVYLKALQNGDIATFQVILDNGGDVNHDLGSSGTPLISALRHNHEPLLEFLLNKRTDVDPSYGRWGHMLPPIGVAVRMNRDIKWMERLLRAGARVEGSGALHVAAIRGDIPRMRLLLQYGANINEVPMWRVLAFVNYNKKGTPVHWAIVGGSTEAVRLLLECQPDLSALDEDGVSVRDRLREAHYSVGEY